jgi:HD-like signal output (HDOD) protein
MGNDTHPVVGAALLEMWYMDPRIIDAVRCHHTPSKSPQSHAAICSAISLTEYVLCNCAIGSLEGSCDVPESSVWEAARIKSDQAQELSGIAETEVRRSDFIIMLEGGAREFKLI